MNTSSDNLLKTEEDILDQLDLLQLQNVGPYYERILQLKAQKYMEEDELYSIFNLVESHSSSLRHKVCLENERREELEIQQTTLLKEYVEFPCFNNSSSYKNVNRLLNYVADMPKEWTIIQLTSQCNQDMLFKVDPEFRHNAGMHISVFNCGQKVDDPYCVTVNIPKDNFSGETMSFAEEFQSISKLMKQINTAILTNENRTRFLNVNARDQYYSIQSTIQDRLNGLMRDFEDFWLRGWKCLFIGKLENFELEDTIRAKIKEFFKKYPHINLASRALNILCNLVKGYFHLRSAEVPKVLKGCFLNSSPDKDFFKELAKHIAKLAAENPILNERKHPIILIIDDFLDEYPWEAMSILKDEPVSRLPSLYVAYALYKKYEDSIVDGHVMVKNYENGKYLLNSNGDLGSMQRRITGFFEYWTPKWHGMAGKAPSSLEFLELLSGDIFLYAGHGNGFQHVNSHKLLTTKVPSVVFLLGCSSTKTIRLGARADMFKPSQYYLIAGSALVVGALWSISDIETDKTTVSILSTWVPSTAKKHWTYVDQPKWLSTGEVEVTDKKATRKNSVGDLDVLRDWAFMKINEAAKLVKSPAKCRPTSEEPELLRALCSARKHCTLVQNRIAFIARGIPVKILDKTGEKGIRSPSLLAYK